MWILMKKGDITRKGDVLLAPRNAYAGHPYIARGEVTGGGHTITRKDEHFIRELKGWEAVVYAIKQEVLGNDVEGCETTPIFWDCECEKDYIQVASERGHCPKCGSHDSRQPDSRIAEVLLKLIGERNA